MTRKRPGPGRKLLPAALVLAGCSPPPNIMDAGHDAGATDAGCMPSGSCTEYTNACGMRCGCLTGFLSDGGFGMFGYCDDDIGNPCNLGCSNPKEADGGREYNGTTPVCLC